MIRTKIIFPLVLSGIMLHLHSPALWAQKMDEKQRLSYAFGVTIGAQLSDQFTDLLKDIEVRTFLQGMEAILNDQRPRMEPEEVQKAIQKLFSQQQSQLSQDNAKQGEQYMTENAKRAEVKQTASGIQYEVLRAGTGKKPSIHDQVRVHYEGTLTNGKKFDSSYDRGQPATFPLRGVIAGWTEILQLMPVGSTWRVVIPSELAYGSRGAGADIPPNSTLIFKIELLDIL